jgi:hypothetical protein
VHVTGVNIRAPIPVQNRREQCEPESIFRDTLNAYRSVAKTFQVTLRDVRREWTLHRARRISQQRRERAKRCATTCARTLGGADAQLQGARVDLPVEELRFAPRNSECPHSCHELGSPALANEDQRVLDLRATSSADVVQPHRNEGVRILAYSHGHGDEHREDRCDAKAEPGRSVP